jgi:hypothetical protein
MDTLEDLRAEVRALRGRVQELEDEREIRALFARHDYNFDCGRDEAWLALWTEDGSYDLVSTVKYPDGSTREIAQSWTGLAELRAFVTHPEGHHRPGFYGHSMHTADTNMVIHVQGDSATVNSYSLLYQEHGGAVSLVSAANNQWTLKKIDGAWRFHTRRRRQVGSPLFRDNLDATPA